MAEPTNADLVKLIESMNITLTNLQAQVTAMQQWPL
jgi:hypothetical protein